ncbi:cytochrome P450 [Mycobacterium mantenii]|uniref:Cytochrome n=1 Tax=Mycobacterium mantenii TaxID=560555 RepID=A0A1X0FM93_MYCNT|nr:cytochrome P450 [Mycobacterium mantenii]MCV7246532.1 cytochrome P450 [Mycobacterium mantenii]ORB02831.1 cytochrome [Mycobacterium mantenii]BBY38044.1 cytochrome P450 [Mycobacterium mantenii]
MSRDFESVDFFRDEKLVSDPQPYYEYLRSKCPVHRESHHDVVMVTGYDEASAAFTDSDSLSACIAPGGPFPGFPVSLAGDDVADLIEQYRDQLPLSKEIMTMDPPQHTRHRALTRQHFTPRRVSETEQAMRGLADQEIDRFIDNGAVDLMHEFAAPYALMNICTLLGIPEEDWPEFRVEMLGEHRDRGLGSIKSEIARDAHSFVHDRFTRYIEDRRADPRDDILTRMATAPFPDGSTPTIEDVLQLASALFIGGSGTTAHLLGSAFLRIAEDPQLQQRLRDEPGLIPNFVEEVLRLEGPIKGTFRLTKVPTNIGGVEVPAGSTLMLVCAAAGRDPRHFDNPDDLDLGRQNARQHRSFGLGPHVCPGAALARAEARVGIESLLDRLDQIQINEAIHGPAGARRFNYLPTYQIRGLQELHLTFKSA